MLFIVGLVKAARSSSLIPIREVLPMVHSLSRSHTSIALLDDEPDLVRSVTCPMCHADASLTQSAPAAGGAWRCVRCGQHWDADRLTAVAAYAVWVAGCDRADRVSTERSRKTAQYRDLPTERVGGTP
jgi:transcription elongation factor Elf1